MNTTKEQNEKQLHKSTEEKIQSGAIQTFSVLMQSFMECSDQVQGAIISMIEIINNPNSDCDEREMAFDTINEALFPDLSNSSLGIDLCDLLDREKELPESIELDKEEADFSNCVLRLMKLKGMTQVQLAESSGVGQPAISMMLSRNCRPQFRTIQKIADALEVNVDELWPTY